MLNDKTTRQLLWIALFAIVLRFVYQAAMMDEKMPRKAMRQ